MSGLQMVQGLPVRIRLVTAAVFALACIAVLGIELKARGDYQAALQSFRDQANLDSQLAAGTVQGKLDLIFGTLRTLSMFPSIRHIDRHGTNLDSDDRDSIQQLYNNLREDVEVSEVYIVPADFNPDAIDPLTHAPETPILMFDELIVDAGGRASASGRKAGQQDSELPPEVETYEYRALAEQMRWFRSNASSIATLTSLERPMLSTPALITCDNTIYVNTRSDADRTGVVFSVPFYSTTGDFRGTVSAIILTRMLGGYLPNDSYVLINPGHGVQVYAGGAGEGRASERFVAAGLPDPSLAYSSVIDVNWQDPQGRWSLWTGRSIEEFNASAAARNVGAFRLAAYALLGITLALAIAIIVLSRRERVRA